MLYCCTFSGDDGGDELFRIDTHPTNWSAEPDNTRLFDLRLSYRSRCVLVKNLIVFEPWKKWGIRAGRRKLQLEQSLFEVMPYPAIVTV